MGANTIRILSCGSSVGTPTSIETARSNYAKAGTAQWDTHDYVIFAAREYGLRVIITLTDDYDTYYGSKYTFLRWRGLNTGNYGNTFYTNSNVLFDFTTYVKALLNHVNPYTNKAWKADPTIAFWETINEGVIKSLSSQLVIDGTDGFYNYTTKATAPGLNVANVDVMSDHGYPRNLGLMNAQIPLAANAGKVFLIGEYDWTNSFGGDSLSSYLSRIESSSINGDMVWSIQGHDAQCCNFVTHNDGYSLYYGNPANSADQNANILAVTQHFYR
ncbi:hypothetical protein RQP46_000580 [Phenoliferia psychrophenolica]